MNAEDKNLSIKIRRSQLSRARGLGSAKSGIGHWWVQRMTAVALVPLSLYFVVSVILLLGADQARMAAYMAEPWNAALFLALIAMLFYHLALGVQVILEDYVPSEATRLMLMLVAKGVILFLALISAASVLKLAFS